MAYHPDRIDGTAEWAKLPPDVQTRIGAAAIELIAAWFGADATADDALARRTAETRAFEAAEALCSDRLLEAVTENVPAIDPDRPPLPASLGDICHNCGRTQEDPCEDGCAWCAPDLATAGDDDQAAPGIPWMV